MAQMITQARPYARAAFDYAKQHNDIADWQDVLATAAGLTAEAQVLVYLGNPKVNAVTAVEFFKDILGAQLNAQRSNFLLMLADERLLSLLPDIFILFTKLHEAADQIETVEVQAATVLSEAQQQKLVASLETRLQRKVKLNCSVNPELIGGAVIRTSDWVIDGSVTGKLQQLKTKLVG
jgi:F-type H+-transporting ATPase subunit delta